MSYFANVENDGKWLPGGTYTYDVYIYSEEGEYGSCSDPVYGPGWWIDPCYTFCYGDSYNSPLFDNYEENLLGDVETSYEMEELGSGWWRVTITIPEDLPNGTYYLKGKNEPYCAIIT